MITIEVPSMTLHLPTTMEEVTLEQRIDFANQYGFELARKLAAIKGLKEGFEQDMELMEFMIEAAACRFSFFSGISLQQLKDTPGMVGTIGDVTLWHLPELVEDLLDSVQSTQYYCLN